MRESIRSRFASQNAVDASASVEVTNHSSLASLDPTADYSTDLTGVVGTLIKEMALLNARLNLLENCPRTTCPSCGEDIVPGNVIESWVASLQPNERILLSTVLNDDDSIDFLRDTLEEYSDPDIED